jgi:2-iminobutanoate/2-iminopropanoate deaminase
MKISPVYTKSAPAPIGPYSQATVANGMLFISGQIGLDPKTGEFVLGGLREQTEQVMQNLLAILQFAGLGFKDVAKTSIFLAPEQEFDVVNAVYGSHLEGNFPARETVWVAQLPKKALVEISMIAVL